MKSLLHFSVHKNFLPGNVFPLKTSGDLNLNYYFSMIVYAFFGIIAVRFLALFMGLLEVLCGKIDNLRIGELK